MSKDTEAEQLTEAIWRDRTGLQDVIEVIGTLVSVSRGKIVLEAKRRFEISVEASPSLKRARGKRVGVAVIDGQVRWRLVEAAPGTGEGGRP
ncbi:MAG: hypothetical protein JRN33_06750 [Nitrososphaerota archaeon]|nr:hypothetical protein [Nitrososphaerota archaeon]